MPHNRCLRYLNTFIFVCIRLAVAIFYCGWLIPSGVRMYGFTLTLNHDNWWHDGKHGPFFTNCSPFNALVCWLLWMGIEFSFYVMCLYAFILVVCGGIGLAVNFVKNPEAMIKGFKVFFKIMWELWLSYLFAKQNDIQGIIA
jgi:hypothetical protein